MIELETEAIDSVLAGNLTHGRDVLIGSEYSYYKLQYASGVEVIMVYVKQINNTIARVTTIFIIVNMLILVAFLPTFLIFGGCTYKAERKNQNNTLREKEKSDKLLSCIFPKDTVARMKLGETKFADGHESVTVLFLDICEFTKIASGMTASNLVAMLNILFSHFDELAAVFNVEKIKTIGDAYLAVAGLDGCERHSENILDFAVALLRGVDEFNDLNFVEDRLSVRIGCHSGSVVSGVIGNAKFSFDIWGDAVNTASRMETLSEPGKINVSEQVYSAAKDAFDFEEARILSVKGKGDMNAYFLIGRK